VLALALRAAGAAELLVQEPDRYEQHADQPLDFDVLVFDRYTPKAPPRIDSLYFQAAPPLEGLELKPAERRDPPVTVPLLDWRRDHALLRHANLEDLLIREPGRLSLPDGAVPLATAESGAVMTVVSVGAVRHVVLSFDVLKTSWPMQESFLVFMTNALDWLAAGDGSDAAVAYRPGESATVPYGAGDVSVMYDGPTQLSAKASGSRVTLPAFTRAGIYYAKGKVEAPWDRLAVNMTDELESNLESLEVLPVGVDASGSVNGAAEVKVTRQDVWPLFMWGALAFLMIEWLVYTRRMHL